MIVNKLEIFSNSPLEIKNFFEKNKYDTIIANPLITLEIQSVPFCCETRIVSETKLELKENVVTIKCPKKERVLALIILIIEEKSNDDIVLFKINNTKIEKNITVDEYLKITDYENTKIELVFEDKKEAKLSTYFIYYLITPSKHDSHYFIKEYKRIKTK